MTVVQSPWASGMEAAPPWGIDEAWNFSLDGLDFSLGVWQAVQEASRIRMTSFLEEGICRCRLHDLACIHYRDSITDFICNTQVVVWNCLVRSFNSSNTWAPMVASSAVVGSSAMMSEG
jgi:hypothetical protein